MIDKLKEKSVQYKIAISVFVIMFVVNILAQGFLEIKYRYIYISVVEFILNFSACFIFALMFKDVSYNKKNEDIINSANFIKVNNIIFKTGLLICVFYLIIIEVFNYGNINIIEGFGIIIAGSAIQQLNLTIRKESKNLKKIFACGIYILFSILFLMGSLLKLFWR